MIGSLPLPSCSLDKGLCWEPSENVPNRRWPLYLYYHDRCSGPTYLSYVRVVASPRPIDPKSLAPIVGGVRIITEPPRNRWSQSVAGLCVCIRAPSEIVGGNRWSGADCYWVAPESLV
jgi:hypothetical protein